MTSRMDFVLAFGIFGVLCAVNNAIPLPADQDDISAPLQPVKLPFSLELEPPLPDSNGAGKPVVLPLRDSYGNPIPPAVLGVDPSGVDYDLAARPNADGPKKTVFTQGINFPIPSYASGITEIHRPSDGLLPPFDSDKKTNNANIGPATNVLPSSISSPVTDLLPPLSIPLPKDEALNEISGTLNFNTPLLEQTTSTTLLASTSTTASTAIPSTTSTSPRTTTLAPVVATKASAVGKKYTGGFGGAAGILGEQKQIGYDVKMSTTAATTTTATTTTTRAPKSTTTITTTHPPSTTPSSTTTTTTLPPSTTPSSTTTTTTLPPSTTPSSTTTTTTLLPSTTPGTTTTTLAPPIKEIVTRSSVVERSRIPIGVAPPSTSGIAVLGLSKVLLPPFESPGQQRENGDVYTKPNTIITTTTTTPATTTTTRMPTTTIKTTTTTTTTNPPTTTQTIDLEKIAFPTTIPLETLVKGETFEFQPNAMPTLSTILLPPRFSSISRPFQSPPTPSTTQSPLIIPDPELLPSARSGQGASFLSLSFGFPNAPTNESPQKTVIGQALQDRFGSNFNVQQLPSFINSLQQANQAQPKPSFFIPVPASGLNQPSVASAPGTTGSVVGVSKPPSSAEPGKYTGGFGGAPGVLGDQKEIGFLVKPGQGGAAASPTVPAAAPAPVSPTTVAPPKPVAPAAPAAPAAPVQSSSGNKYTGGFGGPPGVLLPFDINKKDV